MYNTYFGAYQIQEGKINEKHWYRGIYDNKTGIWYGGRSWYIGPISYDGEPGAAKLIFETQDDCPDSTTDSRKTYDTGTNFDEDERVSVGNRSILELFSLLYFYLFTEGICKNGWVYFGHTQLCYKFYGWNYIANWTEAEHNCRKTNKVEFSVAKATLENIRQFVTKTP